jgi:hypothetical protein
MDRLHDVIADFAHRRGASLPVTDAATGELALALDGRFIVYVRASSETITLVAWVGDLPTAETARQATLRRLLRAELARLGSKAPVLSVDPDTSELSLHCRAPAAEIDLAGFERLLQGLLDQVIRYRGFLARPRRVPPPAPMIIRP